MLYVYESDYPIFPVLFFHSAAAVPRTNYSSVQLQLQLCESLKTIRDPSGSSHG